LAEAIESIIEFLDEHELEDIVLVGHSYGGMIITAVADRLPHRVRRLVYWNAFVPNDGESVYDMLTPQHIALFSASAAERSDGSVMLPFQVWRETLINDVDLETAQCAYKLLNPHPLKTLTEKISLKINPAGMSIGESYITVPKISHCLINIPGTHDCPRNLDCSGSYRFQAVTSYASQTRVGWRGRSSTQAGTKCHLRALV